MEDKEFRRELVGGKAYGLAQLQALDLRVPEWIVLPLSDPKSFDEIQKKELKEQIEKKFGKEELLAIRSSGAVEDGTEQSFAGRFETYLNVKRDEAIPYVVQCLESGFQMATNQAVNSKMGVVIQRMVSANRSGVLFTANPSGLLNEMVVVCGEGIGENVVDNKVDVTTYYYNITDKVYYFEREDKGALLTEEELLELIEVGKRVEEHFGMPQDIEWCIGEEGIYFLQARPITTFDDSKTFVLDNSNIVESYPGITLPLSTSFVKQAYYRIFENILKRLTGNDPVVEQCHDVLINMVDSVNGRIYYRISNWYQILLFLPFNKKIIPIWQEMLGVSEKKVTTEKEVPISFATRAKVTFQTVKLLMTVPKEMERLEVYFKEISAAYKGKTLERMNPKELMELFWWVAESLISKWDITLANDMYAFLYTGLLKSRLKKKGMDDIKVNSTISRLANLESMKPVKELVRLSILAKETDGIDELKQIRSKADFDAYFLSEGKEELKQKIGEYINRYGDRNLEELKMESPTFRTNPELLMCKIVEYSADETLKKLLEENETTEKVKGLLTRFLARRAALGIKNREHSRLNRSRVYGMMRGIFLRYGKILFEEGKLERIEDVFYLTLEELDGMSKGEAFSISELVEERKHRSKECEGLPAYSRLIFVGRITEKHSAYSQVGERHFKERELQGTPCSFGTVCGEVLVMKQARMDVDVTGKILVAKMTDPGWVFLITGAAGVISEKGSLLSHTAIISRELQKPTIVGVKDATEILKDGDFVEMDGGTGKVVVRERKKDV